MKVKINLSTLLRNIHKALQLKICYNSLHDKIKLIQEFVGSSVDYMQSNKLLEQNCDLS